jgi:hypothetical protein
MRAVWQSNQQGTSAREGRELTAKPPATVGMLATPGPQATVGTQQQQESRQQKESQQEQESQQQHKMTRINLAIAGMPAEARI